MCTIVSAFYSAYARIYRTVCSTAQAETDKKIKRQEAQGRQIHNPQSAGCLCCKTMEETSRVVLILLMVMLPLASGRSSGAPSSTCIDFIPRHGSNTPQTSAPPYTITFSPSTFTANGSPVTVTLSTSGAGAVFMGFLLAAQYNESCVDQTLMPGTFTAIANTQLMCSNMAVTHSIRNTQTSLSFQWTPPSTSEGHVRFRATFVQGYATYWVNVLSSDVLMDTAGQPACPAATSPPTQTGTIVKDPACGSTKGCYSDCSGTSCNFLMTWAEGSSSDKVLIVMMGKIGNAANRYIAFGLSNNEDMGDDSVHYCINEPDGVFSSYNDGMSNVQLTNSKEGLGNITVSFQDGVLTCSFTRTKAGGGGGRLFALDKEYTIFWAEGPGSSAGAGYHENIPLISSSAASLQDYTVDISGGIDFPLIKAHGSLMLAAWICFASIGIVLARFFKSVWADHTWFGQKIWFQIHRTCMILCLLATAIAFIIIFVEAEGYSHIHGEGYKKAHPVIGIIVTILTVLNPIMALFRPHPGTQNRPIFNWLHWAVGMGAYILGVIDVFFGLEMYKAGAPDYAIYIMAAFVFWQVLILVVFEVVQCKGHNTESSNRYEMTDVTQQAPETKSSPEDRSSTIKITLLGLHVVAVIAFTITLIAVLNVGEDDD